MHDSHFHELPSHALQGQTGLLLFTLDADWMEVRLVAGHPAGMGVAAPPAGQFWIGANTLTDHRLCPSITTLPCAMRSRLTGHDHSVERLRTAQSAGPSRDGTFFIPVRPNAFGHPNPVSRW